MILLVNPHGMMQGPYFDIPTNLLYLYSALREVGIECAISDGNLIGQQGVKDDIDRLQPELVGVSTLSPVRFAALEILEYAYSKGCITVMGGHHGHWMYEQVLSYPYVDAVVFGEGERTIVDLAVKDSVEDVAGIAYKSGPNVIVTEKRTYIADLDTVAFPAWDITDFDAYRYTKRGIGPRVFYSRGCLGACKFCNSTRFWRGYRHRSPENFCEELHLLYSIGEESFAFGDDNVDSDGIVQLFSIMAATKDIALPSSVTMRVDGITEESCYWMKECNVQAVCLGVESGSQRIMDHMRKGITVEQAESAVGLVKKHGMSAIVLLIHNSIGETAEDKQITSQFCEQVKPDDTGGVNALWLYPGTTYYREVQNGKYDHLIKGGKELVGDAFFADEQYAQHVIAYRDGDIFPMRVTDEL